MLQNFIVCLDAVLPLFLLMALGYLAKRLGLLDRGDVSRMNRVFFRLFMPVMVFYNIYTSDVRTAVNLPLTAYAYAGILLVFLLSLPIVKRAEPVRNRRGVIVQGLFRSNQVVVGLPVVTSLMGAENAGPAVFLTAAVVPLFNALAVIVLEIYGGKRTKPSKLILDILKNPLIIGSVVGLVFLFSGLKLPRPLESAVRQPAQATSPVMLFLLGAFLQLDGLRRNLGAVLRVSVGRLLIAPALTLLPAVLIGFRGVELASLIPVFASSTAVASFTMAQQMGGDAELAGNIVVATSTLCAVTLFLWCFMFTSLGLL